MRQSFLLIPGVIWCQGKPLTENYPEQLQDHQPRWQSWSFCGWIFFFVKTEGSSIYQLLSFLISTVDREWMWNHTVSYWCIAHERVYIVILYELIKGMDSVWSLINSHFKISSENHNSFPQSTVSENNPMQEAGGIMPKEWHRAQNAFHTVGSCICMLDYCHSSVHLLLWMHSVYLCTSKATLLFLRFASSGLPIFCFGLNPWLESPIVYDVGIHILTDKNAHYLCVAHVCTYMVKSVLSL